MWLSVIQETGEEPRAALTLAVAVVNVTAIICGDDVDESCGGDSCGMGPAAAKGLMGAFVPSRSRSFCATCVLLSAVGMTMGRLRLGDEDKEIYCDHPNNYQQPKRGGLNLL